MSGPTGLYRSEAMAAYRSGASHAAPVSLPRYGRPSLFALVTLLVLGVVLAVTVRVPSTATAVLIGLDGPHLVAFTAGKLDPLPQPGTPARLADNPSTLRVVHSEVIETDDAGRWAIPSNAPRPATILLLACECGASSPTAGTVSVRVANPTFLQLLSRLSEVRA